MSFSHTFKWPKGPQEVIITGTFDSWSGALPLVKTSDGSFEITLPLSSTQLQDNQLQFKYVVDGEWVTSENYQTVIDSNGNANNVLYLSELNAVDQAKAKIPEAGGLAVPLQASSANKKDLNTTVLPSEEGKQKTVGEPGIVVPTNPHEIDAFKHVSTVDPKELNAKLNSKKEDLEKEFSTTVLPSQEGKQKTLGEPGIVIPTNPHEIDAFKKVSDVDPKELNARLNAQINKTATTAEEQTEGNPLIKVKEVVKKNKATGEEAVVHREKVEEDQYSPPSAATSSSIPTPAPAPAPASTAGTATNGKTPAKTDKKEKKGFLKRFKNLIK